MQLESKQPLYRHLNPDLWDAWETAYADAGRLGITDRERIKDFALRAWAKSWDVKRSGLKVKGRRGPPA